MSEKEPLAASPQAQDGGGITCTLQPQDYRGLEAVRLDIDVDDELVQSRFRELLAAVSCDELGDEPIAWGDQALIRLEGTVAVGGGPEDVEAQTVVVTPGEGVFLPALEEALVGTRVGEKLSLTLDLPRAYAVERWEGAAASVTAEVLGARRPRPFDESDAYVASVSEFPTAEALRLAIRSQYEQEVQQETARLVFAQLAEKLVGLVRERVSEEELAQAALADGPLPSEDAADERRRRLDEAAFDIAWRAIAEAEGIEGADEEERCDKVMALVLDAANVHGAQAADGGAAESMTEKGGEAS